MGANGQGLPVNDHQISYSYTMDENGQIDTPQVRKLYNVGGINYDAATGQRIKDIAGDNDVVVNSNGKYYLAKTGEEVDGSEVTDESPLVSEDENVNEWASKIYDAINQEIALDPTLSWEQAFARAYEKLNPQYNDALNSTMEGLNKQALQSGFFGQLPTEALKMETAGKLEGSKLQAINELASQLFGQSEDSAYKKLEASQQQQQSKIANLLQMLGIYQNERSYSDSRSDNAFERAMAEAGLTGMWNGKPTLDYLKYQKSGSSSGGGSGSGGGTGGLGYGNMTADEAFLIDIQEAESGRVSPETLINNSSLIMDRYSYSRYKQLLDAAKKNYQYRTGNPVADFRIIAGEQ
jgi:hypothetical protein